MANFDINSAAKKKLMSGKTKNDNDTVGTYKAGAYHGSGSPMDAENAFEKRQKARDRGNQVAANAPYINNVTNRGRHRK